MSKVNAWYVVGILDDSFFGCSQITPKGSWFNSYDEAEEDRLMRQPLYSGKLVVLKRTCQIV